MIITLLIFSSIISHLEDKFSSIKSLECEFVETLVVETGMIYFEGKAYISKDNSRINVNKPDEQIIIFIKDSVFIYIKKDNRLERNLAPISLSHLFYNPSDYYKIDSTKKDWVFITPKNDIFSYPLSVLFNNEYFPEKIKFAQEGVEGRFKFFNYRLNPKLPEEFFSIDLVK